MDTNLFTWEEKSLKMKTSNMKLVGFVVVQ